MQRTPERSGERSAAVDCGVRQQGWLFTPAPVLGRTPTSHLALASRQQHLRHYVHLSVSLTTAPTCAHAFVRVQVLVLAPLVLLPLVARLSRWAWRRLTLALLARQALAVVSAHGTPAMTLPGLQAWAVRVAASADGHYALLALGLALAQPFAPLLTPFLISCTYGLLDYCAAHHASSPLWTQYGARAAAALGPLAASARAAAVRAEQLAGLGLLAGLLMPGRQPALAMLTWHFLRLRYWSPDAAVLHRQVGAHALPVERSRVCPAGDHAHPSPSAAVDSTGMGASRCADSRPARQVCAGAARRGRVCALVCSWRPAVRTAVAAGCGSYA